jgi:type II secretory pathway component PulF
MAVYEYRAIDVDASSVAGTIIADTARQARDMLRDRGLSVAQIRSIEQEQSDRPRLFASGRRLRRQSEVVAFIRELATLLSAGIPLLGALKTLARQHRPPFKAVVQQLADQIAAGEALAEAMGRHARYFDEFTTSIVRVGENTGALDVSLKQLAEFKEKAHNLRSRVISALIYPAVVAVIGVAVSIFLMTYVVPNLLGALTQSDKPLPAVTMIVKSASDFLRDGWWILLLGGAAAAFAFGAVMRTDGGKMFVHRALLKIPLFGSLMRKENTSRMAVVLSALLRNGLQFVQAVRITRRTLRNRVFQHALEDYEQAVAAGKDVAGPLEHSGVFSPMVVQMLAVGQQSGELENMLDQLAESYDRQVDVATQRLTAALEPLMIVLLAVLVGFIAFATILPILEVSDVL